MNLEAPTVDVVEARLLAWAAWRTAGGCADGFPSKSVLHPSWSPPSPGITPTLHVSGRSEEQQRQMDGLIGGLTVKLRDALYVVYIKRMAPADQAKHLRCQECTVRARVVEAKRQLGVALRGGFTSYRNPLQFRHAGEAGV